MKRAFIIAGLCFGLCLFTFSIFGFTDKVGKHSTTYTLGCQNNSGCTIGTLTWHFPHLADISMNVMGNGYYQYPSSVAEVPIAYTLLGTRYQIDPYPDPFYCNAQGHVAEVETMGLGTVLVYLN